jgi:hypothetical protein
MMLRKIDILLSSPYSDAACRIRCNLRGDVSLLDKTKAVITDIHFLVPIAVLLIGVILLVELH